MKIAIIVGTRPEIIKMSPILKECEKNSLDYFVIHTGQHTSYDMSKIFFEELNLDFPKYNLTYDRESRDGRRVSSIINILKREKPDLALVEGDTNSVIAGALAAEKTGVKVGHVEAGLRSYELDMHEELNRIMTDHISAYLFCPTETSRGNLLSERIDREKIFVIGNTIVDAIKQNFDKKTDVLDEFNLDKKAYFLITLHRSENIDHKERLISILKSFDLLSERFQTKLIFPIHPRTEKMLKLFNLRIPNSVKLIPPLGFKNLLQLESNAKLILTDSGGLQEEACILNVPCVTLRDSTERPETIDLGSNILAGADSNKIVKAAILMLDKKERWSNPFGRGDSGKRIVKEIILS